MNGRLYDPVLHRFLMPDNFVQDPTNSQNFNRYAYVLNNPLRYTDPTGELSQAEFDAIITRLSNSSYGGQWSASDPTHLYTYADENTAETFGSFAAIGMQFNFGGGGGSGTSGMEALYGYTNASGSGSFVTTGFHGNTSYTEGENYRFTGITVTNFQVPEGNSTWGNYANTAAELIVPGYGFGMDAADEFSKGNIWSGIGYGLAAVGDIGLTIFTAGASRAAVAGVRGVGIAAKGITQVESKFFLVTREGVALPKGAKIPGEFIENVYRSSTYGIMENGKFVEKLRIDPARFAEPSHFHINGQGKKLTNWRWF